jgi:DNA-binding CsgD family transcriptional regulator
MKGYLNPEDFNALQDYVVNLFPAIPDSPVVSKKKQEQEITSISKTIGSQRFLFVVDMTTFDISYQEGVQRWLGYPEKDFTLKQYWKLVHPGMQKMSHAVFLQMADILCRGQFKLEFMVQRYSSLTALKHYNGSYLLLKRTASVFQYDKSNRLTEYLNEFTIIGKYNGEPLTPVFFNDNGKAEAERGAMVMRQVIEHFLGMKIFSVNELQVARILAYNEGITQKAIAAMLKKSPNTIDTYCKRFLRKARQFFHHEFAAVTDAAGYLKENGLL